MVKTSATAQELLAECQRLTDMIGGDGCVCITVQPGLTSLGAGSVQVWSKGFLQDARHFGLTRDWPEAFAAAEEFVRELKGRTRQDAASCEYESWFAPAPALAAE